MFPFRKPTMSETEASAVVEGVKPDPPIIKPDPPPVDEAADKAAEEEKKTSEEGVETCEYITVLRCLMSHRCLSLCS